MKLEDLIEPECYDTAFWMAAIYDPDLPFGQMGELASEVCRKLRTIAISVLSVHATVNTFYHDLIRSGLVRERYLTRCKEENHLTDHHRSSGWSAALMDTIAAGEFELARRIAELSPSEFNPGHEYEDDYCYAQLIFHIIGAGKIETSEVLGRFSAYAEDEPNARLDLIRSLLDGHQTAFEKAFEKLLEEHEGRIAAEMELGRFEDLHINADRRMFIEGLAMLRLASMCGLATEDEYLFCPHMARLPMTQPFPGE